MRKSMLNMQVNQQQKSKVQNNINSVYLSIRGKMSSYFDVQSTTVKILFNVFKPSFRTICSVHISNKVIYKNLQFKTERYKII